ncbi:PAS domain S-box [Leptolyngbyaceae cyanobacterium JSC-12]|nr:PAS domain S-box [Leptolyngbyaceae cyanobacterium JSC-12]
MTRHRLFRLNAYLVAGFSVFVATVFTLLFQLSLANTILPFYFVAVAISSWHGGLKPGMVAVVCSVICVNYFFIPPINTFTVTTLGDLIRLGTFFTVATIISLLNENLRNAKQQLQQLSDSQLQTYAMQLQQALKAAHMGMWSWNLVTGEVTWSPEHEQLFGLAPGTFDGRIETFEAFLHPEDRESLNQAIQTAVQGQCNYQHEYRVVWQDGSIHWVEGRGQVFYNATNQPVYMAGTIMNIDQRKQAELALMQSEERFRSVFEQSPLAMMRFAPDGRLLCVNPAWETMWGTPPQMLADYNILQDQQIAAIGDQPAVQRAFAGEVVDLPARFYDPALMGHSGQAHWVEPFLYPIQDCTGQVLEIILVSRDVTARKQAEQSLQQLNNELEQRVATRTAELKVLNERLLQSLSELQSSKQEVEDLYNQAPCGYHSLDAEGRFIRINQTELNWLGYEADEILGKQFTDFLTPEGIRQFQKNFPILKQQGWIHDLEYDLRCKDGSLLPISLSATAVKDANGNLVMTRTNVFDRRERKRIDQIKSEFISIVSHELRTPLTSINGALELLSTGLLKPESERGQQTIQIAAQEADRLTRLVNDILDLERLESGKVRLEIKPCNLADLMFRAADFMQLAADQAAITLTVVPLSLSLNIDSDRILQVLTNLLSNAIKFSPPGSTVWLTAEFSSPPYSAPSILFSVKDQGRGIPPTMLESIFERFHQVDTSDSRKKGGTGLGLAICRNIIEQHGGKIWAESVVGQGSCFKFILPLENSQ